MLIFTRSAFRISRSWLLIISWLFAIAVGMILANDAANESAMLIYAAFCCNVSVLTIASPLLCCLCLAYFCITIRNDIPLCLLICFEGISFGYCLMGTLLAFHSAGWLIAFALMLPHTVLQFILFFISYKSIAQYETISVEAFLICLLICMIIVCVYVLVIVPYLNELVYYLQQKGIAYSCWI